MKLLDAKTTVDLIKLVVFVLVTSLATGVLIVTVGNLSFSAKTTYSAVFVDATGVVAGDDVRVAGVRVGSVEDIDVVDGDRAKVAFTVEDTTRVSQATTIAIRYRNLVGQRYLQLSEGIGNAAVQDADATIPVSRTEPALDLTVLFNGFQPLFEALTPDDLNQLSFEVVQVFQGQGGTLESLLTSTASVTQELANRDQVIGELLDNLDYVLDHIADRDQQLTALIKSFRRLVRGLKNDRNAILDSLDGISTLSTRTAELAEGIRPPFVEDIKQLRRLTKNIDDNKAELDRALQVLPIKLEKVGRTAIYGSWFNFYLCDFKGRVRLPGVTVPVDYSVGAERCDLG